MTEDKLQIISPLCCNQHKKTQYESACTVNHFVVSLLQKRHTEFPLFL